MSTVALAARNLTRNRRRSATTLMAMILGAITILLFGGYKQNINYGLQTDFVRGGGHLQVQHKDYFIFGTGDPVDYGIANYEHVIEVIKKDPLLGPMLLVVTPTLQLGGVAGNYAAGVSRTVFASGRVIDDQNRMNTWNEYGFPGVARPDPLTNTPSDTAVIGEGLARVLNLCGSLHVKGCPLKEHAVIVSAHDAAALPADVTEIQSSDALSRPHGGSVADADVARIEMLAATVNGAPNVAELNVVKAQNQGVKEIDDMYIALHLDQAQRLIYGRGAPQVTAIAIQLTSTSDIPSATQRLITLFNGPLHDQPLEVHDFATLNPFYGQALALFGAIFGFIAVLIGAVVLFTISNTMSTAVVERTVEIGTLRAIGVRRRGIQKLFLCEGLLLGILGALAGVAFALTLAYLINHGGLTWTPPGRAEPVRLNIRVWGEFRLIIGCALGLIAIAVMSAWWPAYRAARMNVVEALRHV